MGLPLKEIYTAATPSERSHTRGDFLCMLFRALDEAAIRYCVLHSWEELPENLSSDLDLAVHPHDVQELPRVFRVLRSNGHSPLQGVNYASGGYRFDFLWFEGATVNSVAVDITCRYVEGGLVLISGEALVARRQRRRNFWIAEPATEFAYLLARRVSKGSLSARQAQQLKSLVEEVGRPLAERVARRLFGEKYKLKVIEACVSGQLRKLLPNLRMQLWRATLRRDPLNPIRCALANGLRLIRRWWEPAGIFVVFLGPDGVGKSTLIRHLTQSIDPAFRSHRVFHYRPMLLWRRKNSSDLADPHGRSPHPPWWSVVRLFAHIADYWVGYWLVIRPLLVRSGLVIFDRYSYDLLIDPKRYRYGGPIWVARILRSLIPTPDLVFTLDAPPQVILSRKQEVPAEEVHRQRRAYLEETKNFIRPHVIDTSVAVSQVGTEAAQAIAEFLDHRFQRQHARWLALADRPEQAQHLRDVPSVQCRG